MTALHCMVCGSEDFHPGWEPSDPWRCKRCGAFDHRVHAVPDLRVEEEVHNTTGYRHGCRCQICRDAHASYRRGRVAGVRLRKSAEERFWAAISGPTDSGCWQWERASRSNGYGAFYFDGSLRLAHRFAYEHLIGPIPEGLELDHLCRNHGCVNPDHLEPVTGRENQLRGEGFAASNHRKTHCPQGHAYDEANTVVRRGKRECRQCKNAAQRRYGHPERHRPHPVADLPPEPEEVRPIEPTR